jgi:hypothetical protein
MTSAWRLLSYEEMIDPPADAGSRKLYGGDLESGVSVMRRVGSRIQQLLDQGPARFYKKEAYIQVLVYRPFWSKNQTPLPPFTF